MQYFNYVIPTSSSIKFLDNWNKFSNDFSLISYPQKNNANQFLQHSVGIMEDSSKPAKVVLSIKDPYHKLLQLEPLHPTQKISKQNKNGIEIELMVNVNPELINRILSMGFHCKVLQPASLKKQVKETLLKAVELY